MNLLADSEAPNQTARMRSLIWAFAIRICPKTRFRIAQLISESDRLVFVRWRRVGRLNDNLVFYDPFNIILI